MNTIILFYVPVTNKEEARKISTKLLEEKLSTTSPEYVAWMQNELT